MSQKETSRGLILQQVKSGVLDLKKASSLMNLSYVQTKRVWSRFRSLGLVGLISKKRGKKSNRAIPQEQRQKIVAIIRSNYKGCGPLFVSEKLLQKHQIKVSSEFIRQLMITEHLWIPKKAKKRVHQRRERKECEGELAQMDASDHEWFEGRGPRCHLHMVMDDATSKIYSGYFGLEETTEGYFRTCQSYFEKHGLPNSIYVDKRGTFRVNQGKEPRQTQFGRAMKELGIRLIFAHSPQAKGRVERAFGTLQKRLVWEMRLANISTIEEANAFLPSFIETHNRKYAVEAKKPFNAHRQLEHKGQLKYVLCRKTERTISKSLEVQFENEVYQLEVPLHLNRSLSKQKIEIIEPFEGELVLRYKGESIKYLRYNSQKFKSEAVKLNWESRGVKSPSKYHPWKGQKIA